MRGSRNDVEESWWQDAVHFLVFFFSLFFFGFFSPFSSEEKGGNKESDSSDTLDTEVRLSLKKYINDLKKLG